MTKEEILAKRILKFPEAPNMTDEAIKRNVGNAMQEYADLRCKPLVRALNEIATGQRGELKAEFILRIKNLAEKALQDYVKGV